MKRISAPTFALLLLVLLGIVGSLRAQIAYAATGPNGTLVLHQMNGDGSSESTLALPFNDPGFPTWSRDGLLLAFTASDPANPVSRGENVYAVSRATGAISQLTHYLDIVDPNNGVLSRTYPFYKAFSPDRTALATFSLTQTGAGNGGSGSTNLPVLEIHSLTATANPIQVHTDKSQNGRHHGGEGVDWSPAQNVLAAPLESSSPYLSGGGAGETTAIYLIEPITAAVLQGHAVKLTSPRADASIATGVMWGEHDYQPKFSPNGVGLAYVRSFQAHALLTSLTPDPDIQTIHIINVNTGADTAIIQFPSGRYVTALDWSPDGTQLVFDVSIQATNSVVGPLQQGTAETNQVYVINVNGTGLTQLRGNGNGTPSWSRTTPVLPITLANISTRMRVGSGDNAMIGGFIITGSQSKKVIIRGMGPSLGAVGVQGALSDPFLELHDSTGAIIATNNNWQEAANTNEIPNGFSPGDPRESVIVTTLAPGSYTAVVRGASGETGVGIFEAYDLTQGANSKLANISTRGFVETGDNAMIGGLIMAGGSARVIVRAIGPSLQNAGIANALQDPTLELINGNGASVASNDDWQQAPNTNEIPNGFAPSDPREAVIVTTLSAGSYTAVVRGKSDTVGIAVVEAYNLQ
jgi:hypothetical protein